MNRRERDEILTTALELVRIAINEASPDTAEDVDAVWAIYHRHAYTDCYSRLLRLLYGVDLEEDARGDYALHHL